MDGLPHLEELRRWQAALADPEEGWPALRAALADVLRRVLSSARPLLSLAGEEAALVAVRNDAETLLATVAPSDPAAPRSWTARLPAQNEALLLPAGGSNYVTACADLAAAGDAATGGAALAGEKLLGSWLWAELRAQRGAYGAYATLSRSGVLTMASFRDPGLASTLDVYAAAGQYLQDWAAEPDEAELNAAIIKAVSDIDPYQPPSARSLAGLLQYAAGRSTASRDAEKAALLAATPADVAALGEALAAAELRWVVATGEGNANATDANGEALFQEVLPITVAA